MKYCFNKGVLFVSQLKDGGNNAIIFDFVSDKIDERVSFNQGKIKKRALLDHLRLLCLGMVRSLLSEYYPSIAWKEVVIDHHPSGQPFLRFVTDSSGCESLPHISISHSGTWVGLVLSEREMPMGVDLEDMKGKERRSVTNLANSFFSPSEVQFVLRYDAIGFYRLWTAKEALAKFHAEGLSYALGVDMGEEFKTHFEGKDAFLINDPKIVLRLKSSLILTQFILDESVVCSVVH